MHLFIQAFVLAAICELGDKSQILAAALGAYGRKPLRVLLADACAVASSHIFAVWLGRRGAELLGARVVSILSALLFVAMAFAIAFSKGGEAPRKLSTSFLGCYFLFLIAELGDKTQILAGILGARSGNLALIVAGTTLGALLPDLVAVLLGARFSFALQSKPVRWGLAAAFVVAAAFSVLTS